MENFREIVNILSYSVIGGILAGIIGLLIAFLISSEKENKRLDEVKNAKKSETPPQKEKRSIAYAGK